MYRTLLLSFILSFTVMVYPNMAKPNLHKEKLSLHRIHFYAPTILSPAHYIQNSKMKKDPFVITTHDITHQLDTLLLDLKAYYAMNETIAGYTIQVYTGISRAEAFNVRNMLYIHCPVWRPEIQYKQPQFTVRIGKFLDRLEAYNCFFAIKKIIPTAIIRPDSFPNEPNLFKKYNHAIILNEVLIQNISSSKISLIKK